MKLMGLVLTVVSCGLLIAVGNSQDAAVNAQKEQQIETAKRVKELRATRIATLKSMTELVTRRYQNAMTSADELYEAKLLLLNAEVDAAETDSDRMKLLQGIVEVMKEYEETAEAMVKSARANPTLVLKAKAKRLEAEIALEQCKGMTRD